MGNNYVSRIYYLFQLGHFAPFLRIEMLDVHFFELESGTKSEFQEDIPKH